MPGLCYMDAINTNSRTEESPKKNPHSQGTVPPRAEEPPLNKNNNQPDIMTETEELEIPGAQDHLAHVKCFEKSGNISYDQTDRFPITSRQGCKYDMSLHYCNSNRILAEPLKTRAYYEILLALMALYKHATDNGLQPRLHMLDKKYLAGMKNSICSAGAQHQLISPGLHLDFIDER